MKPRQCPHCGVCANPDSGYSFDDNLNMKCGNCNKVMYPTLSSNEHGIAKRDIWQKNWEKQEKKARSPHKRAPRRERKIVYRRPSSQVVGYVPEQQLLPEPADNLRRGAEIDSGL